MKASGYNGVMEIVGDDVVITRKLFFGKSKGAKSIAIRSITSVQLKKAGLTAGFMQLAFSGSGESKGGLFDAANDENTVMFYKSTQREFEALHAELNRRRSAPTPQPSGQAAASTADEISRLSELHQQGVLSDEEFVAAKRKMLGL